MQKVLLLFQERRRQNAADITFAKPSQTKKMYQLKIKYIHYAYVKTLKRSLCRKDSLLLEDFTKRISA